MGFYLIPTLNKAPLFDISVACPLANRSTIKALKSLLLRGSVCLSVCVCVRVWVLFRWIIENSWEVLGSTEEVKQHLRAFIVLSAVFKTTIFLKDSETDG